VHSMWPAWPEAFEMPGKAIWRLQNATNHWGGDPLWWGGGWVPSPQEPHPRSRPFRPRAWALWASPLRTPNFQTPSEVKSYIGPTALRQCKR